jgi:hypothetical protein
MRSLYLLLTLGTFLSTQGKSQKPCNPVRFEIVKKIYQKAGGMQYVSVAVPRTAIYENEIRGIGCELKKRFASAAIVDVGIFDDKRAAELVNFTYEQRGYEQLYRAYRGRYYFDRDTGREYLEFSPQRDSAKQRIELH